MKEENFMVLIDECTSVIYKSRYVPLMLAVPLVLWSWAAVFAVLASVIIIWKVKKVRRSVNEFAAYVYKDQSWMVEESVDNAQDANFSIMIVSGLMIIVNAAFISCSVKISPWFYYNILSVLIYIIYTFMAWNVNNEMEKLKVAINIYNQLK